MELFDDTGATFNRDRTRRYVLWRIWRPLEPRLMFIGLNPSTANESDPDPTITKIRAYVHRWGYGGFYMLNLFTQVTPYPEDLLAVKGFSLGDLGYLVKYSKLAEKIVFCWGAFDTNYRADKVNEIFRDAYCLGYNRDGSPFHPMYKDPNLKLIKFIWQKQLN